MERKKHEYRGGFNFKISSQIKHFAVHYVRQNRTDLSKWILSIAEEYLQERGVLDSFGRLQNGWGDPARMGVKECPHLGDEMDAKIGVALDCDSDLFIALRHYGTGNSPDAPNPSALLRWLIERELRLQEVITKQGTLTAAWTKRLAAQMEMA